MTADDPKQLVRRGYDVMSRRYDEGTGADPKYRNWIDALIARLDGGSRVLDVGCGSGVPMARELVAAGHHVTGVDISEVQIGRAHHALDSSPPLSGAIRGVRPGRRGSSSETNSRQATRSFRTALILPGAGHARGPAGSLVDSPPGLLSTSSRFKKLEYSELFCRSTRRGYSPDGRGA